MKVGLRGITLMLLSEEAEIGPTQGLYRCSFVVFIPASGQYQVFGRGGFDQAAVPQRFDFRHGVRKNIDSDTNPAKGFEKFRNPVYEWAWIVLEKHQQVGITSRTIIAPHQRSK